MLRCSGCLYSILQVYGFDKKLNMGGILHMLSGGAPSQVSQRATGSGGRLAAGTRRSISVRSCRDCSVSQGCRTAWGVEHTPVAA